MSSEYKTFEGFKPHLGALARVGYFNIKRSPSHKKNMLYKMYSLLVWFIVITYNLQHMIRVVQVRHSVDQMADILFILLTTLNTLAKHVAFNVRKSRVYHLLEKVKGSHFAPNNQNHENILKENATEMSKLLNIYHIAIFMCGFLFGIYPLVNKAMGEDVELTGYFPFDTSRTPVFQAAVAYMTVVITLQAYGNVTMDCTIVSFYAQAKTQIRLLRHNLENLGNLTDGAVKIDAETNITTDNDCYQDKKTEMLIHGRLKRCVEHHQLIVWFLKEVQSIFEEAMLLQFLVMSLVICMTVYKLVGLSLVSAEFVSMVAYLSCMLAQLSIYCFYGTQVRMESELLNESIYSSGWLEFSPQFRRRLLIMMTRLNRALVPRTAYVIPMSLETYISVLKFSYSLFTFLNRN